MKMQKQTLYLGIITLVLGISVAVAPSLAVSGYMGKQGGGGRDSIYGSVSSIQTEQKNTSPTWVLSGHWTTNMINKTKEDFNQSSPPRFDASFSMVMLNGSSRHMHSISNFSLTDVKDENRTISYTGLSTVSLKGGPAKDVPTEVKIFNDNVISIWFDPTKVNHHFGESPIYGIVADKKDMEKGSMTYSGNKTRSW
ncbi:MAG TPA: hypothetical protein VH415_16925 [Nitrososphaeraceae archaeon]|jgi:hypothetical protein